MSNARAFQSLAGLQALLEGARSEVLAKKVAEEAAPIINAEVLSTFNKSQFPSGEAWPKGARGQTVTLVKDGILRDYVRYVATGAKLRCAIPVGYAPYQIGKRSSFPKRFRPLPESYIDILNDVFQKHLGDELKAAKG